MRGRGREGERSGMERVSAQESLTLPAMESRNTPSPRKMPRAFVARHLDIQAFAEEGASLAGKEPLSHYPRLAAEDLDPSGAHAAEVVWEATGRMARQPSVPGLQAWVHLKARAHIRVECQRCMEPMELPLEVDRHFCFVADEAQAARLDDEIEDDVLVLGKDFNLDELIEDELLMALPVSPRHDVCPQPPTMEVRTADFDAASEDKAHPFAALESLRRRH